ncbi:MAG TPA: hypothetical protein VFL83_01090 [Anaeromyxobacter sp.]|nr:hypothetical protein [Anaeromyxobacter sp.]
MLDRIGPKALTCAALLAGIAVPAHARAQPPPQPPPQERPYTLVAGIGFDRGSEELVTVYLDDGSSQTLRANEGFFLEVGLGFLKYRLQTVSLDTTTTIGVKGWNVGASNGSIKYLAFPFEIAERLTYQQVRFGAGLSILLVPKITSSGVLGGNDVDLKSSLGVLFQADWIGKRTPGRAGFYVGARFVWQKLEGEHGTAAVNANAFGIRTGVEY